MALAYSISPLDPPRDLRSAAVLVCANCGDKGKIGISGIGNNPEKIQKMFCHLIIFLLSPAGSRH